MDKDDVKYIATDARTFVVNGYAWTGEPIGVPPSPQLAAPKPTLIDRIFEWLT